MIPRYLPRRSFLRGLGTAIALPWLDSMVPAFGAKTLIDSKMSAEEIAKKSIQVASEICVFTNTNITMEKI